MHGLECKLRQFALKRSVSQPGVVTTQVLILGVFVCICCCFIVLIVILEEEPKHLLYTLEYLIFFLHQETVYKSQPCVVALKCLCDLFTCQFFGLLHKMAKKLATQKLFIIRFCFKLTGRTCLTFFSQNFILELSTFPRQNKCLHLATKVNSADCSCTLPYMWSVLPSEILKVDEAYADKLHSSVKFGILVGPFGNQNTIQDFWL